MSNPQQPELGRSRKTPALDPGAVAGTVGAEQPGANADDPRGPVPAENQPGHHPDKEQDKPDLDAFAARAGIAPDASPAATAGTAPPAQGVPPVLRPTGRRGGLGRAIGLASAFITLVGLLTVTRRRRRRR